MRRRCVCVHKQVDLNYVASQSALYFICSLKDLLILPPLPFSLSLSLSLPAFSLCVPLCVFPYILVNLVF